VHWISEKEDVGVGVVRGDTKKVSSLFMPCLMSRYRVIFGADKHSRELAVG
jgi:hypothetical protein